MAGDSQSLQGASIPKPDVLSKTQNMLAGDPCHAPRGLGANASAIHSAWKASPSPFTELTLP